MDSLKKQYFKMRADSEKEIIEEDRNLAEEVMKAQGDLHRIDVMMGIAPGLE